MIPINPIVRDSARPILDSLPLSNDDKAALWDTFHSAPTADHLAAALSRLPAHIVEPLVQAKRLATQSTAAIPAEHAKAIAPVLEAIELLGRSERETLDVAEKHVTQSASTRADKD